MLVSLFDRIGAEKLTKRLIYMDDVFKFVSMNFPYFRKSTERCRLYIRQNLNEKTLFLTMDQKPTGEFDLESPLQTNLMWWVNPSRAYEVDDAIGCKRTSCRKKPCSIFVRFETLVKDVMYNPNKSTFGDSGRHNGCYSGGNFGCRRIDKS